MATMRKLKLQVQMTVDGFVAGPNQSRENPVGVGGLKLRMALARRRIGP